MASSMPDTIKRLQSLINVARGKEKAELVIKNSQFFDVFNGQFVSGDIAISEGLIVGIGATYEGKKVIDAEQAYVVPGFIDAHVHIESSMLTPNQYQRVVLPRGTTTVIWDPHEITSIKGTAGIKWALGACNSLTLDVFLMLPSCVPSLNTELEFETTGSIVSAKELATFTGQKRVLGLAEMMNFPGVLQGDSEILEKISLFADAVVDGHCPLLTGKDLNAYIITGIHSDHEVTTVAEGKEKIRKGMNILIREGSCAKNAADLLPLLNANTAHKIAFCSDDRNPIDLSKEGHIDLIVNKALKAGHNPVDVFRAASFSAAKMFNLKNRGAIAPGYIADLCLFKLNEDDWTKGITVDTVYKNGRKISDRAIASKSLKPIRFAGKNINIKLPEETLRPKDLHIQTESFENEQSLFAIEVIPEQIFTNKLTVTLPVKNNCIICAHVDGEIINKIAVFERHNATGYFTVAFVKGLGLTSGAIATTINHDAHNIIVSGSSDELISKAVNELIKIDGGIVVVDGNGKCDSLQLPIGGLMTDAPLDKVLKQLEKLKISTNSTGCQLKEPFLQLAFLALPVIPSLKITDRGLIDVDNFTKIKI